MPNGWTALSLEDIERVPLPDQGVSWLPVRAALDIRAFGVNAWTGDAGAEVIGPHDETDDFAGGHVELYLVVSGAAILTLDMSEVEAPAGTLVAVRDRSVRRRAVAQEDATTILTMGAPVGAPFKVAAWEFLVRAGAAARLGELDEAVSICRLGLEVCPGSAELRYHLACYESLSGRLTEARADLADAIASDPAMEARAADDPDLEPLRREGASLSSGATP